MLLPGSSCVCIPSFRPVVSLVFLAKIPFLAFFKHKNSPIHTYMHTYMLQYSADGRNMNLLKRKRVHVIARH